MLSRKSGKGKRPRNRWDVKRWVLGVLENGLIKAVWGERTISAEETLMEGGKPTPSILAERGQALGLGWRAFASNLIFIEEKKASWSVTIQKKVPIAGRRGGHLESSH